MISEIKRTADGSCTLYVPELEEHYHSINGAVQESMHVFINTGLLEMHKKAVKIFEMGFGTGLNALLSYQRTGSGQFHIDYHAIEAYPLDWAKIDTLKYQEHLKLSEEEKAVFKEMHTCKWGEKISLSDYFSIFKEAVPFEGMESAITCDLIYFDAFAPEVQPNLWEEAIFEKLYKSLSDGGILVTYCAKGVVRRRMINAGFTVERLPGPPGKREILRAGKTT